MSPAQGATAASGGCPEEWSFLSGHIAGGRAAAGGGAAAGESGQFSGEDGRNRRESLVTALLKMPVDVFTNTTLTVLSRPGKTWVTLARGQ